MRFTVSQSSLATAVSVVSKGIASSSTLPILSGIYIKAENGTLEFQTANLTVSIKYKVAANVEEPGETVVSGRILSNIVKNLPDVATTFEGSGRTVDITCGSSRFHLNALNPVDFPDFPEFSLETSVELPKDVLAKMVDKVYRVTSRDTSRPILGGIFMTVENNTIRLVATDSYRLAVCDTNVETSSLTNSFEMIIPGSTFHDVLSLPSDEKKILVGSTESQVVFDFGNITYVSRRIEGNYPNYKQLLPVEHSTSVKFDVETLSSVLKRVSVVAVTNPTVKLDIDADGNMVTLSSVSSDQGDATESIEAEVEGQTVSIAFNHHYLLDCLNAIGSGEVTLELKSGGDAGIFKSYGTINYLYLLMPVNI